jgi:hypothetical protein
MTLPVFYILILFLIVAARWEAVAADDCLSVDLPRNTSILLLAVPHSVKSLFLKFNIHFKQKKLEIVYSIAFVCVRASVFPCFFENSVVAFSVFVVVVHRF